MKAFCLMRMVGSQPDLPVAAQGLVNWVFCDRIPTTNWGAYLVAATGANLQALDTQWAGFVGIVAVTESGDVRWGELENPTADAVRTKINNLLEAHNQPTIPAGWTNRQVVRAIYERANAHFDLSNFDIMDVG